MTREELMAHEKERMKAIGDALRRYARIASAMQLRSRVRRR